MIKIVHEKTFETIQSAVNKLVNFVRPTYGASGNKVIISKQTHKLVVDDGVQVARDFELEDPAENAVVNVIREVAIKTNDRVGDGTTSSLIMLQAIINEVSHTKFRGRQVAEELKRGLEEVKEHLTKTAKQISSKEDLKKVALISFDNEPIAEMIAELYHKLGKDGIITIDKSSTMGTTTELTDGIKIDRGFISPYMITNPDRMEAVVEKPYILLTDYRLTNATDLIPLMEKMAKHDKRELVVICDNMEQSALSTAVVNKIQGKFLTVAIVAPSGDDRKVFLEDVALLTGAKMFSEGKGDKLESAELSDLGRAEKFICKGTESIIVSPKGKKSIIKDAVSNLKSAIALETNDKRKDALVKRLGMFTNSIAVIRVGAPTENEQRALKYKVEDATNAVRVAYRNGVVCGAGLALANIKTSSKILNEALQYPSRQLAENMGIEIPTLVEGHATNVVTGKSGKYMDVGVADPVDVLIAGVESAVSIASMLVTSSGIIVEVPKEKE